MSAATKKLTYDRLIPYRLWFIAETMEDLLETHYRSAFNLSRADWRILSTLTFRQPMSGKSLAVWTSLDQTRISQCLAKLRARGLISRTTDARDRRHIMIQLTPQGTSVFAAIYPRAAQLEKQFLSSLSTKSYRSLLDAIEVLENYALNHGLPPVTPSLRVDPPPAPKPRRKSPV